MTTRENWKRLKEGILTGLARDIDALKSPINYRVEEYLNGKIMLRCTLLGFMDDIEHKHPIGTKKLLIPIKEYIRGLK